MRYYGDGIILVFSMVFAVGLVAVCVLVHYEALRLASIFMPRLTLRPRKRILFTMGAAFAAHSIEVWICAVVFYVVSRWLGLGALGGQSAHQFYDYLYYSTVSYTSLGLGDVYPLGVLRMLTGVEALIGLAMIAWTGSFTYLAMERFWSLHPTRGD